MLSLPWTKSLQSHRNSQLLDLLLDVNESKRIPLHLYYDIRSPTPDATAVPGLEPDRSPSRVRDNTGALAALAEARSEMTSGQITPRSFKALEAELLQTINRPSRTLAHLEATPHTTLASVTPNLLPSELDDVAPVGYYSPSHEQEYLSTLDNILGGAPANPRLVLSSHTAKSGEREKEKDAQLRNPVSVHNWLRKHNPAVFLQDEPNPDKVSPRNTTTKVSPKPPKEPRVSKKAAAALKQEQEMLDDEGYVIGGNLGVPTKNKRKREDEPYRPKGGSSRSAKRKKTSLGATAKRNAGEDDGS